MCSRAKDEAYFCDLNDARRELLRTFKGCGWKFSEVAVLALEPPEWSNAVLYQVVGSSDNYHGWALTLCNDGCYR